MLGTVATSSRVSAGLRTSSCSGPGCHSPPTRLRTGRCRDVVTRGPRCRWERKESCQASIGLTRVQPFEQREDAGLVDRRRMVRTRVALDAVRRHRRQRLAWYAELLQRARDRHPAAVLDDPPDEELGVGLAADDLGHVGDLVLARRPGVGQAVGQRHRDGHAVRQAGARRDRVGERVAEHDRGVEREPGLVGPERRAVPRLEVARARTPPAATRTAGRGPRARPRP